MIVPKSHFKSEVWKCAAEKSLKSARQLTITVCLSLCLQPQARWLFFLNFLFWVRQIGTREFNVRLLRWFNKFLRSWLTYHILLLYAATFVFLQGSSSLDLSFYTCGHWKTSFLKHRNMEERLSVCLGLHRKIFFLPPWNSSRFYLLSGRIIWVESRG